MTGLEFKNISYIYSTGTPFEKKALDDVSISFKGGCITGLIGHTGSIAIIPTMGTLRF